MGEAEQGYASSEQEKRVEKIRQCGETAPAGNVACDTDPPHTIRILGGGPAGVRVTHVPIHRMYVGYFIHCIDARL